MGILKKLSNIRLFFDMIYILKKTGGMTMAIGTHMTSVLNGTISAIKSVLPLTMEIKKPTLINQHIEQEAISVLIGMTGDLPGRLILDGSEECMGKIGEAMFGMPLEGEMLESFSAELGNMIAGNLATSLAQSNTIIDITTPTVLVGKARMSGFEQAISLPIQIENIGTLHAIVIAEI